MQPHFIFYVSDQQRSTWCYTEVLATAPRLNVPGITQFNLSAGSVLSLMPESGTVCSDKVLMPVCPA